MFTENFNCDAANGQTWSRDGLFRVIRFDGATAGGLSPRIRVRSIAGSKYDCELVPGRMVKIPESARGIMVTNISGAASMTGEITIGDGDISDNSVMGEVSVIDGESAKSKAGLAFFALGNIGPIAAQYGYLELWNPGASARRVIVSDLMMSSNVNAEYQLQRTTALISAALIPPSKSSDLGAATTRYSANTAAAVSGTTLEVSYLNAYQPVIRNYKQPIVIEPNRGLALFSGIANIPLRCSFQFTEEPV